MTNTDRDRFVKPFTEPHPTTARPRRSRVGMYTAVVATLTLLAVVTFGLLWLYGGEAR